MVMGKNCMEDTKEAPRMTERHIHVGHKPEDCRASFGEALQAEIADHNNRIQTHLLEAYQRAVDSKG